MRIILFTGKGGVGKTTIAAATAIKSAKKGKKTLVISTDPAHSLADAFDCNIGPEPTFIQENLFAQELDVYYSMHKYWQNLRQLMLTLFRWQGMESVLAEELTTIPGMEEGAAFMWIEKYYSENEFDIIIIDSAPTGETLTLLTLPQVTKWWVTKTLPFQKFAVKTVGKGLRKTIGLPLDKGFEELEIILEKLEKINKVLSNPEICSVRIVCNPEKMVINEAKRAYTYLQLYGYNVDAIIINRIFPTNIKDTFFEKYLENQQKHIEDIESSFNSVPVLKLHHSGQEIFGIEMLEKISDEIYSGNEAEAVLYNDKLMIIENTRKGYRIKIKLLFLDKQEYKVKKFGDELIIEINNQRRNIFLPRFTNLLKLYSFYYNNPWLVVELIN